MFGSPETQPGGRALKFYASIRMDIRRVEILKQGNEMIGSRTRVKVVKNKLAPPFKEAEFDILYGEGISREGSVLDVATELEIVNKSGAWYTYGDVRLGQGRENARLFLKQNPELCDEIERLVRERVGLPPVRGPERDGATGTGVAVPNGMASGVADEEGLR